MSLADCFAAALAKQEKAEIYTGDPEFKTVEREIKVIELQELEKPAGDPSYYLSDGRITLIVSPWNIQEYAGTGIERPAPEHIGFKVESLSGFKKDVEALSAEHPESTPRPMKPGSEGEARLKLFMHCKYGEHQLADPDGVLIDVSEH